MPRTHRFYRCFPAFPAPKRSTLRAVLACSTLLITPLAPVQALDLELPEMGLPSDLELPRQKQKTIGARIYSEIQKQGLLLQDRLVQDYLSHLGFTLVSYAGQTQEEFTFFVLKDPAVNAFATPGGYIGVNVGLILAMQNEGELAAVVAHEISHVTQQHLARAFGASKASNVPLAISLLAALLVGGSSAQASQAILYGSLGALAQQQVNFTRSNEEEADRVGIRLLSHAGYDPRAMAQTFAQMAKLARFRGASVPEFLRSHPLHSSRISDALSRADQYVSQQSPPDPGYFYLMRARIRALIAPNPAKIAEQFRANLRTGKLLDTHAARYGLAISLIRNNEFSAAGRALRALIADDGERIPYYVSLANALKSAGRRDEALNALNRALEIYPDNLVLSLAAIDIHIDNKQARLAERKLRPLLSSYSDKPELYDRLSRIAAALKRPSEAYLARAESFYLKGHLGTAIEQLEQAQRLPLKNENIGLRVSSRLKQLKKELKDDTEKGHGANKKQDDHKKH